MTHVVMFSGGASSYIAAKRVVQRYAASDRVTLLFADTKMEDEDLYRFADDVERKLCSDGVEMVKISDGRTPWEVFRDVRFLGNTRADPCSLILKREFLLSWLKGHCDTADTTVHIGFSWDEDHRKDKALGYWAPWTVDFPLMWRPWLPLSKSGLEAQVRADGIELPRLYEMGFSHNNCGGFCIKAGMSQFRLLLEKLPDRYLWHEQQEEDLREYLGKDVTILRDRRGGETRPMTLREFRRRVEAGELGEVPYDGGACSCFSPEAA